MIFSLKCCGQHNYLYTILHYETDKVAGVAGTDTKRNYSAIQVQLSVLVSYCTKQCCQGATYIKISSLEPSFEGGKIFLIK